MSGNLPGTRSYAMRDRDRPSPRHTLTAPREFWAAFLEECARRNIAKPQLLQEAVAAYLPTSRSLPPAKNYRTARKKSP